MLFHIQKQNGIRPRYPSQFLVRVRQVALIAGNRYVVALLWAVSNRAAASSNLYHGLKGRCLPIKFPVRIDFRILSIPHVSIAPGSAHTSPSETGARPAKDAHIWGEMLF